MSIQNILAIHQLATAAERADGAAWYPVALDVCRTIADEHGLPCAQVVGVMAALSPRNRWERNIQDCQSLIKAYKAAGASQAALTKVCTFGANKAKAIKILESGLETMPTALDILSGPKLKEFASCIAGLPDVCIDGHAYCIWNGGRTSLADVPAIGVKLRRQIKADYVAAADQLGITPAACQAITWVAWRRIHGITK